MSAAPAPPASRPTSPGAEAAGAEDRGFLRTLPISPGSFFAGWAREPGRFSDLLPNPFAAGALGAAADRPPHPEGRRRAAAAALTATNRAWGACPRALGAAASLADSATLAVVTGQQPGLFGGPLYSLVKALSTVAAARRLEAVSGRPAAAVFWIEGDDHDFEEIRNAWLLDRAGTPRCLRYRPGEESPGLPAFRRILDGSVGELLAELKALLPATEFRSEALLALSDAYAPGRPLSEAFGRLMLQLTRGTGLIVMDPTVPELKRLASPVYETAMLRETEGRRRIGETTRRIEAAGYRGQAAAEGYGVFRTGANGVRLRLAAGETLPPEAESWSAAVLLRPLVQDFLLPTAAYVGGPSEIAYHAQLGGLYELHGIPRPFVIPRHQISVLSASQLRVLDEDGIGFDELSAGDEAALNRKAADPAARQAISGAQEAVTTHLREVEGAVGALDGSLTAASRRALGKMLQILGDLDAKAVRAAKRRDEERRQRFLRARNALFPAGTPQERRLGPIVFWNRYGPGFAGWLLDALEHPDSDRRARNLLLR